MVSCGGISILELEARYIEPMIIYNRRLNRLVFDLIENQEGK